MTWNFCDIYCNKVAESGQTISPAETKVILRLSAAFLLKIKERSDYNFYNLADEAGNIYVYNQTKKIRDFKRP